jgi:hypothetical protein
MVAQRERAFPVTIFFVRITVLAICRSEEKREEA